MAVIRIHLVLGRVEMATAGGELTIEFEMRLIRIAEG
jgi:hypothetical protein